MDPRSRHNPETSPMSSNGVADSVPNGASPFGNSVNGSLNNPSEMPKGAGNHGNAGGAGHAAHHAQCSGGTGSNAVNIADYFNQLVRDKKNLQYLPNYFLHCERLLDEEINKVKNLLCSATDRKPLDLPDPKGPTVTLTEKIFVPVDKYPNFNFVGRILGPQGTTAKDIEMFTGCKIMVRGEGSMRDKKKEEQLKGKPNFEHLNEKLHVLIQCEDTHNRGEVRMEAVIKEIKKLLDPKPDGEDEIKRRQLMGLAVINGTYRETNNVKHHHHQNHHQTHSNNQAAAAAQQLAMFPELAGLFPALNPNAASLGANGAGLNSIAATNAGFDQATLLAQLNQANLASLIGGNHLRSGAAGSNGMNRFGMPNLFPGVATSLPVSVTASQNAFLQASGLQSPAADAGLLYAAGYDPSMLQLGLLSASSPVASGQSDIGTGAAGSSESSFGAQKAKKLQSVRTGSPYARNTGVSSHGYY